MQMTAIRMLKIVLALRISYIAIKFTKILSSISPKINRKIFKCRSLIQNILGVYPFFQQETTHLNILVQCKCERTYNDTGIYCNNVPLDAVCRSKKRMIGNN